VCTGYLYFYFDGSERTGKRRWEWFLTSWITDALTDYFPMKLIRTRSTCMPGLATAVADGVDDVM
jgi:hypothetical protein